MLSQIVSKQYTDAFGNVRTSYVSNANDKQLCEYIVDNVIRMVSTNINVLTVSPIYNEITSTNVLWLDLGFRVGQTISFKVIEYDGTISLSYTATIVAINSYTLQISSTPPVGDGHQYTIAPRLQITADNYHKSIDLQFNLSLNGASGNTSSLIDGENTTFRFEGIDEMSDSDVLDGIQLGNRSGQFSCTAFIEKITDVITDLRRYKISLIFINSGSYNQDWFTGNACLKHYTKLRLYANPGETFGALDLIDDFDGDTGFFDEPYNLGVSNSSLVQGINSMDYYNANSGEFTIQSTSTDMEIGALYIPKDDAYYKNKSVSQSELSMRLSTEGVITAGVYFGSINPNGAQFTFVISTPTIVGDQYTFTWSLYGNPQFQEFFENRDNGDRKFILYFRAGTKNIILFDGQLTKSPIPAGVIPDIDTAYYLNHSQNITDANGIDLSGGDFAYLEDDVACIFKFKVLKGSVYKSFVSRIEAYNPTINQKFTLQESVFNMQSAQISPDGRQLVNASINQGNNLPSTSLKKVSTFGLEPSLDDSTKYGLKCYYPFIFLWQYWQQQLNANSFFWPNQNKNWLNYQDTINDWVVAIYFGLASENQIFEKRYLLPFRDYNTGNTLAQINLYRPNGDLVSAVVDGEIMTIEAVHETDTALNIESIWTSITVEPKESNPRYLISNIIGNGNDSNNPLSDIEIEISGLITYVRCKFDTNKINTQNGVSFGSRIFGNDVFESYLLQENLDYILQENTSKIVIE